MAAIMVGDIVGYSAMMEQSEEKTVALLAACQALMSNKVTSLDGRIFNRAGDATLAEFPSPINALRCAVEIGVALAGINGSEVAPLKMRLRARALVAEVEGAVAVLVYDAVDLVQVTRVERLSHRARPSPAGAAL
jgi:class 3 adenylate cyclase